jgi:hypothetical protein
MFAELRSVGYLPAGRAVISILVCGPLGPSVRLIPGEYRDYRHPAAWWPRPALAFSR